MKKYNCFVLATLTLCLSVCTDAVSNPAYARQTGKSCTACHSIPPQLKFEGRKFKILNYTEVNPEYEFLPDLELLQKTAPVALRTQFTPTNWVNGSGWSVTPGWELSLYGASRLSERGGVFAQVTLSSEMDMAMLHQLKFSYRLADIKEGKAYWSIAGGVGPPSNFDVYMSINPMQRITSDFPYVFPHMHNTTGMSGMDMSGGTHTHASIGPPQEFFQMTSMGNMGVVTNLWAWERLWINTGIFKGITGTDPDFWGRIAFEPIKTSLMVGGFAYLGKEGTAGSMMSDTSFTDPLTKDTISMLHEMMMGGKTDVLRVGGDFEFEKAFTDLHILKVMGAYSYIKDITPAYMKITMFDKGIPMDPIIDDEDDVTVLHSYYVQGMYMHKGVIGPVIQYDWLMEAANTRRHRRVLFGLKWYIRPNINITGEFTINPKNTDDMKFGLVFDTAF